MIYQTCKIFATRCTDWIEQDEKCYLIVEKSPFYAEMGGQVGDTGTVTIGGIHLDVLQVVKDSGGRFLHQIKKPDGKKDLVGSSVDMNVDLPRRLAIQQHHTATHVLHWALREVLGDHIRQAGSLVEKDRLRFDFSHFEAVSTEQLKIIERLANEKLLLNDEAPVLRNSFCGKA